MSVEPLGKSEDAGRSDYVDAARVSVLSFAYMLT